MASVTSDMRRHRKALSYLLTYNRRHQTPPRSDAAPGESVLVYGFIASPIPGEHDAIRKPEVCNVSQRRQK